MGNVIKMTTDGLRSMLSGLGDPNRDKSASTDYAPVVLTDQQLINAYRSSWIARKLVDIPAHDSLRKWRNWQAEQEIIEKIEKLESRLGVQKKLLQCKTLARLWGGAAIFIGTDQDPSEELDLKSIKKDSIKYLTVFSRKEITAGALEQDPFDENYGKPSYYEVSGVESHARIHPSRLIIQIGSEHADPWTVTGPTNGWGDSVLQAAYEAVKNADATASNISSLVFEANVDVFGVPDFMASLSDPAYEKKIIDRFTLAAAGKGINKSLIHDATETYDRKQVSFAQLPEVMQQFLLMVSGASDIPMTRFLGQSPAGMSSTGEGDMKNYHDKIQSMQTLEIEPAIYRLDECLIRSALGDRPEDIWYEWAPLEQMSEKQIADIGKTTADTVDVLSRTGAFTSEELRKAATNQLVENGVFPGLDKAVSETDEGVGFGFETEEDETNASDAKPRTLYVHRKVKNAKDIIKWAKSQGLDTTLEADSLHVTIAFSRTPIDWMKVGEAWSSELKVAEGGPRLVEKFEGGAVVLAFKSHELDWRHRSIIEEGASWDWTDYQSHITITYDPGKVKIEEIEPYQGEIVLGPEIFEEVNENWKDKVSEE